MSRKNRHQFKAAAIADAIAAGHTLAAAMDKAYEVDATYQQPGTEGAVVTVSNYSEPAAPSRFPYRSEITTFTTRQGGPAVADLMTEYINTFANEHNAALLSVHPMPDGAFLFVWEMPT